MPSRSSSLPKNWPQEVLYLTTPSYSKILTPTYLTALRTCPKETIVIPPNVPKGPSSHVKITPIIDPSHPANGQSGLFAVKDLKPGTFILQYLGEIHLSSGPTLNSPDPHRTSDYDLSLDRELGLGIDADKAGNEARYINDFRGVPGAERPNAEFNEIWDGNRKERGMGVWVLGKSGKGKGIKKGEEILVSYGRGFWKARKDSSINELTE